MTDRDTMFLHICRLVGIETPPEPYVMELLAAIYDAYGNIRPDAAAVLLKRQFNPEFPSNPNEGPKQ